MVFFLFIFHNLNKQIIYKLEDIILDINKTLNNIKSNNKNKSALKGELVSSGKILGLFQQSPSEWLKYGKTNNNIDSNFIEELILKRNKAREVKNFQEADKIRDELTNINIEIEDTIDGTIWRSKN